MKRPASIIAGLVLASCQKTGSPPAAEPTTPFVASAPQKAPAAPPPEPAPAPAPGAAAPAAGAETAAAAAEPTCQAVAKPPLLDVRLSFTSRKGAPGSGLEGVWMLVAKVSAPSVKLSHEVWSSPAPTSCSARQDGEAMAVECITDEGQLHGRLRVVADELVFEASRGGPSMAPAVGAGAPEPPQRSVERERSVKVPCGTRLRVHPASRDYR